ncbi:hypothetical protein LA080_008706 [Diaporthe eres]|nr:hypothetical protein LA080_008706 [Diaporthe eres]
MCCVVATQYFVCICWGGVAWPGREKRRREQDLMKPRAAEVHLRPSNLGGLAGQGPKAERFASLLIASHRVAPRSIAACHSALFVAAPRRYGHVYRTSTYMRPIPDMMGDAP